MQTTQDIIKILPFQAKFKDELLEKFDSFTPDQKYAMEKVLWDFYDAVYENRLDTNMKLAFEKAKRNEEKLDHAFYERVRNATDRELAKEFSQAETSVDLSEAREELQKIMNGSSKQTN